MTTTESKPGPATAVDDMSEVRPRLRHDVLFADTGDGVVLRDADEGFVLKGRTAYRFTASLAPFLTGELTVGELCAQLDPGRQRMIAGFVRNLIDRGFARDARPSARVEIEDTVLERFGPQLDYVEHYADDAANRFLAFRNARVLVFGRGPVAQAAALGLLRNGVATVDLLGAAEPAPVLTRTVDELVAAGCPARVRATGLTTETALEPGALDEHDLVIASADEVGAATIRRLVDLSLRGGPTLLPAATVGTNVVAGPVTGAGTAGCWTCAMLRYGANCDPRDAAALWRELALPGLAPAGAEPGPQLSAMIGNLLAFDLFRLTTDSLRAETDTGVLVQDIATLAARRERLWPHPLCPSCADLQPYAEPPAVTRTALADAVTTEFEPIDKLELGDLLDDVGELVGEHLGVVAAFDDAVLDQSPMKVSRVRLGSRLITAFDLHYVPVARRTALRAAALVYVGELAALRDETTDRAAAVAPEELTLWSGLPLGAGASQPWLDARSVVTGDRVPVPAAAVYPFSRYNSGQWFEATGAGDGAGATLVEAVRAGLGSALSYQALRDAAAGLTEGRPITPAVPDIGSELEFLQRTAANQNLEIELTELSGWRHTSIVLARVVDDTVWTVAAAPTQEAAVLEALRDVSGIAQIRQQLGAGAEIDLGRPMLSQLDLRSIRRSEAPAAITDEKADDLVGELAAAGYDVLVVATTTADLQAQGGIVTARVLLRRPSR